MHAPKAQTPIEYPQRNIVSSYFGRQQYYRSSFRNWKIIANGRDEALEGPAIGFSAAGSDPTEAANIDVQPHSIVTAPSDHRFLRFSR